MSTETPESDNKPFDPFELATAILLGLAAVGAALASLQAGQWGGRQLDAFSASNALTTKAAKQYNEDTVLVNADYAAVAAAKEHILEARDANDGQARERHLDMASYQYSNQMTELGYKAMGLPLDYYIEDEEDAEGEGETTDATAEPAATASAEAAPAPSDSDTDATADDSEAAADPETEAATALERDIPDEALFATLQQELDDDYIDKALEGGEKMFAEADAKFEEGRLANNNGDGFDLSGVIYTVALFFAGLGLVFKTRLRWGFFFAGCVIFLIATAKLAMLPWAG